MKRALVVKALTDRILLVRTDAGDLVSLSVPRHGISAGSLILIDSRGIGSTGCVDIIIRGESISAMVIEHKDGSPVEPQLALKEEKRHVI